MVFKTIKVVDLFQTTRAICLLTMVVSPITREKLLEENWQFLSPAQTISKLALDIHVGMRGCGIASKSSSVFSILQSFFQVSI